MTNVQFKIVVPVFNAENWIQKCLVSIASQQYNDFSCVIIDDASTDNTGIIIDDFLNRICDERFSVVHNRHNKKALRNIVEGFDLLDSKSNPESVLIVVDGDDYLFSEYVLALINEAYQKTNCLLTYGSFIHWPTGELSFDRQFPAEIIKNNDYRNYKFVSSHLRTYKSKLWNAIKKEDLLDTDGDYFKVGCDVAFMIPMLEMSGGNFQYIRNILYVYNRWNPISDDVINQKEQVRVDRLVRKRQKYKPIL